MAVQQARESRLLEAGSGPHRWSVLFHSIFCGALAGFLAGFVVLGFGSRLAMRVVAMLNTEAKGTLTDAGETVGAITLGGTVALIVFGGGFGGMFTAGIWVFLRERLPERLSLRIPLAGLLATLVGSFALIDAGNDDFRLFDPVVFNLAMFMILIGLTGSTTALVDWVLQRRLPPRTSTDGDLGPVYAFLAASGVLIALPFIFAVFFVTDMAVQEPPRVAGAFFWIAAVGTLLSWVGQTSSRTSILSRAGPWIGYFGLAGLMAFGGLHMVGEITEIL